MGELYLYIYLNPPVIPDIQEGQATLLCAGEASWALELV